MGAARCLSRSPAADRLLDSQSTTSPPIGLNFPSRNGDLPTHPSCLLCPRAEAAIGPSRSAYVPAPSPLRPLLPAISPQGKVGLKSRHQNLSGHLLFPLQLIRRSAISSHFLSSRGCSRGVQFSVKDAGLCCSSFQSNGRPRALRPACVQV